jgi:hypothetical protein
MPPVPFSVSRQVAISEAEPRAVPSSAYDAIVTHFQSKQLQRQPQTPKWRCQTTRESHEA